MKGLLKIFAALSFLLALNGFMYADGNHQYYNYGMNQEMMNNQIGTIGSNCISKYNFLTGILNVPCVDVGGEIYWINLKLKQEGNKILLELVDAGKNDNFTANYQEQMRNQQGMMDEDEMMNNQNMMDNDEMMNNQRMGYRNMNYNIR